MKTQKAEALESHYVTLLTTGVLLILLSPVTGFNLWGQDVLVHDSASFPQDTVFEATSAHPNPSRDRNGTVEVADSTGPVQQSIPLAGDSSFPTMPGDSGVLLGLDSAFADSLQAKRSRPELPPESRLRAAFSFSWLILQSNEIRDWQSRIKTGLADSSLPRYFRDITHDFEVFNNSLTPSLGLEATLPLGFRLGMDAQFFRLRKSLFYLDSATDTASQTEKSENWYMRGFPCAIWLSASIPESLFNVTKFEAVRYGFGLSTIPWLEIWAYGGTVQSGVYGRGYGLGFRAFLSLEKRVSTWWKYQASLNYSSLRIAYFRKKDGGAISRRDLLDDESRIFEMNPGFLQFIFSFVLSKTNRTGQSPTSYSSPGTSY